MYIVLVEQYIRMPHLTWSKDNNHYEMTSKNKVFIKLKL